MYNEGGIQWFGGYLTANSYIKSSKTASIGQFQITGTHAHLFSQIPLNSAYIVLQYFIDGQAIIVPNLGKTGANNVMLYSYPTGGEPTEEIRVDDPRGVVVSHAPSAAP
jgi:hypothetical protein